LELNALEKLLIRSSTDTDVHQAMFHELLRSNLWVFVRKFFRVAEPTIIAFPCSDGSYIVPAFTSVAAMTEGANASLDDPRAPDVLCLPATQVLKSSWGQYVRLNPRSLYGCVLTPKHIELLLCGKPVSANSPLETISAGTDIEFKELRMPLPALEARLIKVFDDFGGVTCAYLVVAERLRERAPFQTLMMVAEATPCGLLENAVSTVFSDVYDNALPVDVSFDEGDKGFVDILKRVGARPFYDRTTVVLSANSRADV
jgi:hypothetical protein